MQRYAIAFFSSILLALIGYIYAVVWSGSDKTLDVLAMLSLPAWLCVLGLSLANYLLRFVRWKNYVAKTSDANIPTLHHLLIYAAGFALTTTPGKAGEALRSFYLKPYGVGYKESLSVLFVERLVDLIAIVLISMLAVSFFDNENILITAIATSVIILIMLPMIHSSRFWALVTRIGQGLPQKFSDLLAHIVEMVDSSAVLLKNRVLYSGLGLAIVAWALEGLGFYIVLQYMNVECDLLLAVGIYAIAVLVGAVSFMPGGLGGTEAVMGLLLVSIGADTPTAVAATLVCRIVTLWFAVLIGILASMVLANKGILPQFSLKEE